MRVNLKKSESKSKNEEKTIANNTIDQYFKKDVKIVSKTHNTTLTSDCILKKSKFSVPNDTENNPNKKCLDGCKICSLEYLMNENWRKLLQSEFQKNYFSSLKDNLHRTNDFFPPIDLVFNFSNLTDFNSIKVVILGQDPYHNTGQAMGLSFSVPKGIPVPPSLKNIYSELSTDIKDFKIPKHGDLTSWAKQGVLLLNDTLTVTKNMPASHASFGWKNLTSKILELINQNLENVVLNLFF